MEEEHWGWSETTHKGPEMCLTCLRNVKGAMSNRLGSPKADSDTRTEFLVDVSGSMGREGRR
jgi:hypothetical protein